MLSKEEAQKAHLSQAKKTVVQPQKWKQAVIGGANSKIYCHELEKIVAPKVRSILKGDTQHLELEARLGVFLPTSAAQRQQAKRRGKMLHAEIFSSGVSRDFFDKLRKALVEAFIGRARNGRT